MEHTMIAKVYALVAEMEAIKAEIEVLKLNQFSDGIDLQEKADELNGISRELQELGRY